MGPEAPPPSSNCWNSGLTWISDKPDEWKQAKCLGSTGISDHSLLLSMLFKICGVWKLLNSLAGHILYLDNGV